MPFPSPTITPAPDQLNNQVDSTDVQQPEPIDTRSPEDIKAEEEIFVFTQAKPYLSELEKGFASEVVQTTANRERRKIDIDIEVERKENRIKNSDLLIPMRVIDENIAREKPAFIAYLQNSNNVAIFVDPRSPHTKFDDLQSAFTRGMRYNNWIIHHHKTIDGAQLHGWDWYEILYDEEKPLHCGVEHVGHDRLEFSLDAEDIQNNTRISRVFKWTRAQIDVAVKKYGFSKDQANKLKSFQQQKSPSDNGINKDHVYTVKKGYCKWEGVVYVYWYSLDVCDDWLKAPQKFYNGVDEEKQVRVEQPPVPMPNMMGGVDMVPQPPAITTEWQPTDETLYPLRLLPFEETEAKEISTRKGRAFKDKFKQEAMTAGVSSYLNGHNRATWLVGSKTVQDGKNGSELQSIELKDGCILPVEITWNRLPYPAPEMLAGLQFFDTKNAQSIGQMTYAVQNKSSGARTTAKEIESAQQDTALLNSVNITLFSAAIRDVFTAAWRIVQSQALQDKIEFYGVLRQIPDPTGQGEPVEVFENNKETIGKNFDLRPAGDVEVIQRQEMIAQMKEYWDIIINTPIANEFLGELLKLQFAEQGEKWAKMLTAGDPKVLLAEYFKIVSAILANPQEVLTLGPQEKQSLQMLLQQTQQILATSQPQQGQGTATNGSTNQQPGQQPGGNSNGQPAESGMAQG